MKYTASFAMPVGDYSPKGTKDIELASFEEAAKFSKEFYIQNPIGTVHEMFEDMGNPFEIVISDDKGLQVFDYETLKLKFDTDNPFVEYLIS